MSKFYRFLMVFCLIMLIPVSTSAAIQRYEFDQILKHLQKLYEPEFRSRKQVLQIRGYWEGHHLEASARYEMDHRGKIAVVTITGALARHAVITEEAFATIACHEIGHFLAGQPAVSNYSTEGQADYFAASECMRRLLPSMPVGIFSYPLRSPPIVKKRCTDSYTHEQEIEICIRSTMGGYGLSSYVAFRKSQDKPSFEKPDPNEARLVSFEPMTVQCRLDTYIAASLCNPAAKWPADTNRPWLCSRKGALAHLSRPVCWYPKHLL